MEPISRDATISSLFDKGLQAHNAGDLSMAEQLYQETLAIQPDHCEANHNIGMVLAAKNNLDKALKFFKYALDTSPNVSLFWASYIDVLIKLDRITESKTLIKAVKDAGIHCEKIEAISKLLNIEYQDPGPKDAQKIAELIEAQNFDDAIKTCLNLMDTYPSSAVLNINVGKCYFELGQIEPAIASYKIATEYQPKMAASFIMLGQLYSSQGNTEQAIENLKTALTLQPEQAELISTLGLELFQNGDLDEAIEYLEKGLTHDPSSTSILTMLGNVYNKKGDHDLAINYYQQAIELDPVSSAVHTNIGVAMTEKGNSSKAIESYKEAIRLDPNCAEAHNNLGIRFREMGKLDAAIESFSKALIGNPDYQTARGNRLFGQAHICDWVSIEKDRHLISQLGTLTDAGPPFGLMFLEDAPERHLLRSKLWAKNTYKQKPMPLPTRPAHKPKRLRIGYFSSDFREHSATFGMLNIFQAHDRDRFEIYGYSFGPDDSGHVRKQIVKAVDAFVDVQEMTDMDIALLARKDKIDIAIDLNGYTKSGRTNIFTYRAAPIQIHFWATANSSGADHIDYYIGDVVNLPKEHDHHYSESIIRLPYWYQAVHSEPQISSARPTRTEMGLPEDGFVFCCFNNGYKLSPIEFKIWMRLLDKVEGSVLWLLKSNKWMQQNLQQEAIKSGISPDRLIFSEYVSHQEHLARQSLADLFIDTFNVNAGVTAGDALWVGLPMVTKLGKGLAARVCGSLLMSLGMPELVTKTEQEYEALILELATNPKQLAKVKQKLEENRLLEALFDSKSFTKHLEDGYLQAYQLYFDGKNPKAITVSKTLKN